MQNAPRKAVTRVLLHIPVSRVGLLEFAVSAPQGIGHDTFSAATTGSRETAHYRQRLAKFADLSHVTVEVQHSRSATG
jgi:hypothetical protein